VTKSAKPKMRDGIVQRGRGWAFVLDLGPDPATGRRRQSWRGGYRTRAEAKRARDDARAKLTAGTYRPPERVTLAGYLRDEWLPSCRTRVEPGTYASCERNLTRHVIGRIGAVGLAQLTPAHLNRLYADLLEHGRVDGRGGLDRSTVALVASQLRRALADAVRTDRLPRNPADVASPPRPGRRVYTTWTAEQTATFLTDICGERLALLVQVVAATGMRIGEAVTLTWPAVDLDEGFLTVARAKTGAGRRRVALDPFTVAALRAHRADQAAERLAFGAGYAPGGLVFTVPGGEPLNPDAVLGWFKRRAGRLGLPVIRLHDLRHGWATLALATGEHPKVVAEQLGHASIRVTLDTYTHVVPGLQARAAERVAGLFLPAASATPAPRVSRLLANEPDSHTEVQEAGP
jgi:integrase